LILLLKINIEKSRFQIAPQTGIKQLDNATRRKNNIHNIETAQILLKFLNMHAKKINIIKKS